MKALVVCAGGGIGDVLLATPVMRALRTRYDSVVALTAPAHREVLEGNPDLAAVLLDDAPFWTMRGRLAREHFDAAVVTWATARHAALLAAAGIPVRVGQSRRLYSPLFTQRVDVRSEAGDRTTHWTQILLDFARRLDCDTTETIPRFALDDTVRAKAGALRRESGAGAQYAILHPTRGIATARARWPAEPLGNLGRALIERYGVDVIVSGAAGDRAIADDVAHIAGGRSLAARTSLREFGALAEAAQFVVAMDSGPMHHRCSSQARRPSASSRCSRTIRTAGVPSGAPRRSCARTIRARRVTARKRVRISRACVHSISRPC